MSYDPKISKLFIPMSDIPEIMNNVNIFYDEWLNEHRKEGDLNLYHYTTGKGIKGIIENRSIWCSHIKYTIDPSEWHYGRELVMSRINRKSTEENNKDLSNVFKSLIELIRSLNVTTFDTFVACFCENDNLLSQWQAYAQRGGGYSLGFIFQSSTNMTYNHMEFPNAKLATLRKIIYDKKKQKYFIDLAIKNVVDSVHKIIKHDRNKLSSIAISFVSLFVDLILSFKNRVFEKEEEWRIIIHKSAILFKKDSLLQKSVYHREKQGELIPYLDTNIYDKMDDGLIFPLKSITIGPALDPNIMERSLRLLLDSNSEISHFIKIDGNMVEIYDAGYRLRS